MRRSLALNSAFCLIAAAGCSDGSVPAPHAGTPDHDSGVAGAASCPEGFEAFDPGDSQRGEMGAFTAELVEAEPPIPAKFRNVWTLVLRDPDGAVAEDVSVTRLETFMPVHGHPGQPEPTASWDAGQLRAELHFTMRGPWEVRLAVASESGGSDRFFFGVCVQE